MPTNQQEIFRLSTKMQEVRELIDQAETPEDYERLNDQFIRLMEQQEFTVEDILKDVKADDARISTNKALVKEFQDRNKELKNRNDKYKELVILYLEKLGETRFRGDTMQCFTSKKSGGFDVEEFKNRLTLAVVGLITEENAENRLLLQSYQECFTVEVKVSKTEIKKLVKEGYNLPEGVKELDKKTSLTIKLA